MYLSEDILTSWVNKIGGLCITRSVNNVKSFNFNRQLPFPVILTGYNRIISLFFDNIIQHIKTNIVLILIESDIINITKEQLNNNKIVKCFSWNTQIQHEKLVSIPIGLNFKRHYKSIITWIKENNINENTIIEREKLVCFNCSLDTSPERVVLKEYIDKNLSHCCEKLAYIKPVSSSIIPSFIEGRIRVDVTNPTCYNDWKKYKFILSPFGTGIDCHRTWEAIMLGCIPIVKSSGIDELFDDLPVVIVQDWDELTEDYLNEKYDEITINKKEQEYNYNKLYFNYWKDKIEHYLFNLKIEQPHLLNSSEIHFITYGDDKYAKSRERLINQANSFGVFNTTYGYTQSSITPEFREKYSSVLEQSRGGGYWLWKLDIIKQTLDKINENDFIVYLDAGCHLNKYGIKRFYEYINKFENNDYGILSFQMIDQPEYRWTTSQILEYFNVKESVDVINTGQYVGGVLILRKNAHLRQYLNEFEKCVDYDMNLITDKYNSKNQKDVFKDNRHDQSISSIIRKLNGSIVIKSDESWVPPFGKGDSLHYPFWASRSKK